MNVQAIIYFLKRLHSIYGIKIEQEILIFQNQIVIEIISAASYKYGATIVYSIFYYRTEQKTVPTIKDCESQWDTTILFTLEHAFIANKIRLSFTMEEGCSLYTSQRFICFHHHHDLTQLLLVHHILLNVVGLAHRYYGT